LGTQHDRVAIVTGGGRGIGRAIADRFRDDGYRVSVFESEPVDDSPHETMSVDVSDSVAVDRAVADVVTRCGKLDVMVCNAGIGGGGRIVDLTDEQFRRIVDVNLFGVFACCRAAARVMIPRTSGVIITIGSIFGQDPPAGSLAYGAAKAGVAAMTKSLARELGSHHIRVNCISPGHIETEMYAAALRRRAEARQVPLADMEAHERLMVPLGHFGQPEHIARVALFLASEDAAYITGQRINVDGGVQPY
jgi:NAD(P)-dependent dehydrogenase (short-subunit alcohol dehydrogenase family)